jgi:hypothetical protein
MIGELADALPGRLRLSAYGRRRSSCWRAPASPVQSVLSTPGRVRAQITQTSSAISTIDQNG